ncbi:MAG: PepSY-like domain-containing protein [Bacteroidaceae bacterium]|nr:PepSY-like domain-containing protein [Bacteroidaceae bacterium]
MKKFNSISFLKQIFLVLFASVPLFATSSVEGVGVLEFETLPYSVQLFVNQNFPNRCVISVKIEYVLFKRKIKVTMNDGTKIDFDGDGDWIDIENASDDVLLDVIPCAVMACVHDQFNHAKIIAAERHAHKLRIELVDHTVLTFNDDYDLLQVKER